VKDYSCIEVLIDSNDIKTGFYFSESENRYNTIKVGFSCNQGDTGFDAGWYNEQV